MSPPSLLEFTKEYQLLYPNCTPSEALSAWRAQRCSDVMSSVSSAGASVFGVVHYVLTLAKRLVKFLLPKTRLSFFTLLLLIIASITGLVACVKGYRGWMKVEMDVVVVSPCKSTQSDCVHNTTQVWTEALHFGFGGSDRYTYNYYSSSFPRLQTLVEPNFPLVFLCFGVSGVFLLFSACTLATTSRLARALCSPLLLLSGLMLAWTHLFFLRYQSFHLDLTYLGMPPCDKIALLPCWVSMGLTGDGDYRVYLGDAHILVLVSAVFALSAAFFMIADICSKSLSASSQYKSLDDHDETITPC